MPAGRTPLCPTGGMYAVSGSRAPAAPSCKMEWSRSRCSHARRRHSRTGWRRNAAESRSSADPQARQHRIGQRIGVKQRQISLMHIAGVQVLMRRVDLGAPQRIGVGPQHRFWARRGAGGVLHAARRQRIADAARPVGAVSEQRFRRRRRVRRRLAPASLRHRAKSPRASAGLGNARRSFRHRQAG